MYKKRKLSGRESGKWEEKSKEMRTDVGIELDAAPWTSSGSVRGVSLTPRVKDILDVIYVTAIKAGLKPSGDLLARVAWFGSAGGWREAPVPADEPTLRRAAAATPSGAPLEHLLDFVAAVRDQSRPSSDLAAARAALAGLRAAEPDLDSPELPLDGLAIAAVLGIEPGPAVGEAVSYLREQRFERGPFDVATATRLLRDRS